MQKFHSYQKQISKLIMKKSVQEDNDSRVTSQNNEARIGLKLLFEKKKIHFSF